MKKLAITLVAGIGIIAFARRSNGRNKRQGKPTPTPLTQSTSTQPSSVPARDKGIDPGIVVHSPFNGDPGIVVRSDFAGDPGIVIRPAPKGASTPGSHPDQLPPDEHRMV